jgi:Lrp/AsnC family leucine-responsive transcriptional regulator
MTSKVRFRIASTMLLTCHHTPETFQFIRNLGAHRAKIWHHALAVLDRFDLDLLNLAQRDDARTAESLAEDVPLSPSAIARRLRRLRGEGWIARTIALLSPRLVHHRLRALVLIQLSEHADLDRKNALERRMLASDEVQFLYEIAGPHDFVALIDCASMADFNACADDLLASSPAVRRYETHFVKRDVKFAPFVALREKV